MGMAFNGLNPNQRFGFPDPSASGGVAPQFQMPMAASPPPIPAPQAPPMQAPAEASPGVFAQGGVGRNIAGYVGDYLAKLGGGSPIFGPMQQQHAAIAEQMQRQAATQQAEYQRQMALAQWKRQNPEPGSVETNYNFISGKDPKKADAYLANVADPVVPYLDPTTGTYNYAHKSGAPVASQQQAAIPSGTKMTINGKDAWYVNGDWYDNPEGR